MQRIRVTDEGILVTYVEKPLISVFGNVVRPGSESEFLSPWDDVYTVWLGSVTYPPDEVPTPELTIDLVYGEYMEIHADAEGFGEAIGELCRRSGVPVPATYEGTEIWFARE
ncbi:hypothetical protein [Actinoplanes sp. G11-F43]|uniref:hypothetical protein n=1 Tax=Actinoplanes sp. G11-F43 TaxID=3424130 RepID=UPI003D355CAC